MPSCACCGQERSDGFRFCAACGAELASAAPAREQRKTVTERVSVAGSICPPNRTSTTSASKSRMMLARTLDLCGKRDEARGHAAEALALCVVKGDQPAAGWARELLDSLS